LYFGIMALNVQTVVEGELAGVELWPGIMPRPAVEMVAVVDVSGSMASAAEIKTSTGSESHGLSSLNVVQHATQVLIASLTPADAFALVSFDSEAQTEFALQAMTPALQARASAATKALEPRANTNLWAGVEMGLQLLPTDTARLQVLVVLTDGVDNDGPAEGVVQACRNYLQRAMVAGRRVPLIYTFGLGTNLESPKLVALAAASNGGLFEYIHDAASVGTVFSHALANIYSTVATQTRLIFADNSTVALGALYANQAKRVLFPAKLLAGARLSYEPRNSGVVTRSLPAPVAGGRVAGRERGRDLLVTGVEAALRLVNVNQLRARSEFAAVVEKIVDAGDEGLLQDAIECNKALEYTSTWGLHFLRGMSQNHRLQACAHFRDVGCAEYTSPARTELVTEFNAIFNALPPPQGSLRTAHTVPVPSMAVYNSSSYDDPCFPGWCRTQLASGAWTRVDNLVKGDVLMNGAQIECVVKTHTVGFAALVQLERLFITPYHPIRVKPVEVRRVSHRLRREGDTWVRTPQEFQVTPAEYAFPCELGTVVHQPCQALYSFVLSDTHLMNIEGYECVALGHYFTEEKARHPYFGTAAVRADLGRLPGFAEGFLEFNPGCLVRSKTTQLVTGFNADYLREPEGELYRSVYY
jgi:hypothetical protein